MAGLADAVLTTVRLNTDLFTNVLDGVTAEDARARPAGVNPIAFLAAHLVDARHFMTTLLGDPLPNPIGEALADARSADEVGTLPSLDEVRREWAMVAEHLEARLAGIPDGALSAASPQRFPVDDESIGGGLVFLAQHESYHLGQMALLRRQLGHAAMTYDRRPRSP